MAVRKEKGSWWIDFRFNHMRYRKRSPDNSKAGAHAYEATLRRKLANGESLHGGPKPMLTFGEFAWKWFDDYVVANNKISEQRTKKYRLQASLIPFFGKKRLGEISARDVERYKAQMLRGGMTNKSIRNQLTVLNKCLSSACDWNLCPPPPKINWPKTTSYRTDYLSPEECAQILGTATGVVREMILLALRTGMRQGELKGLQWSSIDWHNRSLAVRHSHSDYTRKLETPKNNRERHIPLDSEVYDTLKQRKKSAGYVFLDVDGKPFNHKRLDRRLTTICAKAGIRRITWHVLRHTFASHLAMQGVPLHVVQQLLGHANIGTTVRYAHVAPSALRSAIQMLNPKKSIDDVFGQPVVNPWLRTQQAETIEKGLVA
jgi:integrase